ncbi:uncharacterized protein LOC141564285 isoform X2 [Sminthopsis crassicaudata]|uniref:uncharacterized protein LOC141564285 isoform X2 n=1 Tax=Sminthopsis crassicaudata TaxID=9301 RepID=UPI003D681AB9
MALGICRAVLITGCSRGIGLGLVRGLLARSPAPDLVIATCRNPDQAQELQQLKEQHQSLRVLQLDIVCEDSIRKVVRETEALVGEKGLNCLINNAGINRIATLDSVTAQDMLTIYETNTVAQLMVSKTALNMITCCLAADLMSDGILCISLEPGWVKTDMGGSKAPLQLKETIPGILNVLANLREKDHGAFLDWKGEVLPW